KFFQYHWIPALMPLGLLAGAGLWAVVQTISARAAVAPGGPSVETAAGKARSRPSPTPDTVREGGLCAVPARCPNCWVVSIGLLTPIAWSLVGQWPAYRDGLRVVRGALPLAVYQERFGQPYQGDYSYLADVWAAEYVRAVTRPADGIFIWGFEP